MLLRMGHFLITIILTYLALLIQEQNQIKKRNDNIIYANLGLSRPITKWMQVRLDYFYYNRRLKLYSFCD